MKKSSFGPKIGAFVALVLVGALGALSIWLTASDLAWKEREIERTWITLNNRLDDKYTLIPELVGLTAGETQFPANVRASITALQENLPQWQRAQGRIEHALVATRIEEDLYRLMRHVEVNQTDMLTIGIFQELHTRYKPLEATTRAARMAYNSALDSYNYAITAFPGNVIAGYQDYRRQIGWVHDPEDKVELETPPDQR